MATHSSILAWEIPWTEEPGRLQSMWLQRVGHDWVTNIHTLLLFQFYPLSTVILKNTFIYFLIYLAVLGLSCGCGIFSSNTWDLVPWPEIEPRYLALGAQNLSHWSTRAVSSTVLFFKRVNSEVKSLSYVRLFVTPTRLLRPWDFPDKSTGVVCHFLLQGIFPTQGSNPGLLHCRQTLLPSEPPGKSNKQTKKH